MKLIPAGIKEYLSYDELTGVITWIKAPSRGRIKAGDIAGSIVTTTLGKQYLNIMFKGQTYKAHRIAWFLKTGNQPKKDIDHVDGNGLNNPWANIREATKSENSRNYPKPVNNTSGYKGVSWHKRDKKWMSCICINNKNKHLGSFDNPEAAYKAYCNAAKELYGEFANYGY